MSYLTETGVVCREHGRKADRDEPCWMCDMHAEKRARDEASRRASANVKRGLEFLLIRIGSWTSARYDQHLRHEMGDEAADEVIAWLGERVSPSLGPGPNGEPLYRLEDL